MIDVSFCSCAIGPMLGVLNREEFVGHCRGAVTNLIYPLEITYPIIVEPDSVREAILESPSSRVFCSLMTDARLVASSSRYLK